MSFGKYKKLKNVSKVMTLEEIERNKKHQERRKQVSELFKNRGIYK